MPPASGLSYFLAGPENRLLAEVCTTDPSTLLFAGPILLVGTAGSGRTSLALHLAARLSPLATHVFDTPEYAAQWSNLQPDPPSSEDAPAAGRSRRDRSDKPSAVDGSESRGDEALYLPAIDFARDYAESVEVKDVASLQRRLLSAPALVIDDLEQLVGKAAAQSELARRIESRTRMRLPTIIVVRRMPTEIRGLDPLLVSRCLPGLAISVAVPSTATRQKFLAECAVHLGITLRPEWISMLDAMLADDIPARNLESSLRAIDLRRRMHNRPIDLAMIQEVVDAQDHTPSVSMDEITRVVGRHFRMTIRDLKSPSRRRATVRARSLAMYLCNRLGGHSTHRIGDHFGGRDHTTVMHAIRKMETAIRDDDEIRRAADEIEEALADR